MQKRLPKPHKNIDGANTVDPFSLLFILIILSIVLR